MWLKTGLFIGTALAVALLVPTAASAQGTDFIVSNDSDYAAVSFQTAERTGWSRDWIPGDTIRPGEQFSMEFTVMPDACNIPTKVTFEDGSQFERVVDYCDTAMLSLRNDAVLTNEPSVPHKPDPSILKDLSARERIESQSEWNWQ